MFFQNCWLFSTHFCHCRFFLIHFSSWFFSTHFCHCRFFLIHFSSWFFSFFFLRANYFCFLFFLRTCFLSYFIFSYWFCCFIRIFFFFFGSGILWDILLSFCNGCSKIIWKFIQRLNLMNCFFSST